jgi:hypothetical protein
MSFCRNEGIDAGSKISEHVGQLRRGGIIAAITIRNLPFTR